MVKLVHKESRKHYSNLIIGQYEGFYHVWANYDDHQFVFEKTKNKELAIGSYNLWIERFKNEGLFDLEQYKNEPVIVEGYEKHKHPFLKA